MIFISHDLSLAAELADRVATMYAGEIVEVGNVRTSSTPETPVHGRAAQGGAADRRRGVHTADRDPGSPPNLLAMPSGCSFHPRCPYATELCARQEPPLFHGRQRSPDRVFPPGSSDAQTGRVGGDLPSSARGWGHG